MQVNVHFLDNLKLQAQFDNFTIMTDQPVRYKGDGTAPSPFDYFLASSALCAGYFVKVYCRARDISTDGIVIRQNNTVNPDNRYHQDLHLQIDLPEHISDKDKKGILSSMERCTVKRVIQNNPEFLIDAKVEGQTTLSIDSYDSSQFQTIIPGKDSSLEETITTMSAVIGNLNINLEIASWRNPVPHVWSVHVRDADSPLCYTNGKGATKEAALCSALGEYLERLSSNYFYSDYYLGSQVNQSDFVHYPNEKWFPIESDNEFPPGLMDDHLFAIYGQEGELKPAHLIEMNSGAPERGICAIPFHNYFQNKHVYIPVGLIANLFVSNGMSAGNTISEARVQALSEIFERAVKNHIIQEELTLPDVPRQVLEQYPTILAGIKELENKGYPVYVKDASLGGVYPVINVTLMNPHNGGVFASFGAHPQFEVALERTLTELLQGRSFEGLNDTAPPTFNSFAVNEPNNIIDHFIDSTGVISWKFFSNQSHFEFCHWNFSGSTQEEFDYLMSLLKELGKQVYIADYTELGTNACRILVPSYSEIYPADDLIWDNNNRALLFRKDILTMHNGDHQHFARLIANMDECEIDDYMPISELIGVAFDESSAWGRLTAGELKALLHLAQGQLQEAKNYVDLFLSFNDNTHERKRLFQLIGVLLDIELEQEGNHSAYKEALIKMYGKNLFEQARETINGHLTFPGLPATDMSLKGLHKHQELLASYLKLSKKRSSC